MSFVKITSDEIIAIKDRLNIEMNRRQYNGSLTAYAGTDYQFETIVPNVTKINKTFYNKITQPLNSIQELFVEIQDDEYKKIVYSEIKGSEQSFDTILSFYEQESIDGNSSSCSALCSGLCVNTCSTGCSGCSGTCTGNCTGTCSTSCSGQCKGGCSGCSGSCSGGCYSGCSSTCGANGCSSVCEAHGCSSDSCTGSCFANDTCDHSVGTRMATNSIERILLEAIK